MTTEVWILGGTGRSGRAIAAELLDRGLSPVLVGRDATRLQNAAANLAAPATIPTRVVVAASIEAAAAEIQRQQPAVVINTIGPFTSTAGPVVRACLPGSHYVDLANDLPAVAALLDLDQQAQAAGKTLVTGAGFGVTATESVVVQLSQRRNQQRGRPGDPALAPAPARVRVDMVPSLAIEAGVLGEALAGTILDGFPDARGRGRYEGRRYENGRLVRARIAGDPASLTLPDGTKVTTASMPLGELIAAQRASGAPNVVSASSEAPSSPAVRAFLPLATTLLAIGPVRAFARKRLAAVKFKARERPREYSYGHARLEWPDGTVQEGWLRLGDAQAFTGAVPAEVAHRLLNGQGRPGAYTPAALFGPGLAEACGAEYLTGQAAATPA
jgi:Saccharopine dehydrogenase NADP binding domain